MENGNGTGRQMLRHTIAALAYRAAKAVRETPAGFADFQACDSCRTPGKLLAHLGDLFDWALSMATGENKWQEAPALAWDESAKRFFAALQKFDDYLASDAPLACSEERLFQGPVADALTARRARSFIYGAWPACRFALRIILRRRLLWGL